MPSLLESQETDHRTNVLVVGSGIIGISICNKLLKKTGGSLKVSLLEKHQPCFGATGAGQGYIWMAHRDIGSAAWDLAAWSKQLWAQDLTREVSSALEWQDTGSLLLASNQAEGEQLKDRVAQLQGAGFAAEFLDQQALKIAEPALAVTSKMAGLSLGTDAQINGRLAADALLRQCFGFGDRFTFFQGEGLRTLLRNRSGEVLGATTEAGISITASTGVVLAAGAWTGEILAEELQEQVWRDAFMPRKGHLLEIERPKGMPPINSGLMETGYISHYVGKKDAALETAIGITFTATTSKSGTLLLGSSREFAGFEKERSEEVERAILQRATRFLPGLRGVTPLDSKTRVGLRPYSRRGPVIGGFRDAPGLLVACGHEGSGLTLAPATAEIIACSILHEAVSGFAADLAPDVQLQAQI